MGSEISKGGPGSAVFPSVTGSELDCFNLSCLPPLQPLLSRFCLCSCGFLQEFDRSWMCAASNNATLKTAATYGFTGRGLTTRGGETGKTARVKHEFPGYQAGSVLVLIKTAVGLSPCSFL